MNTPNQDEKGNFEDVYVFKTSIKETDLRTIAPLLNIFFPKSKWTFDLSDIDNVLRIESETNITEQVISVLTRNNYFCEELK